MRWMTHSINQIPLTSISFLFTQNQFQLLLRIMPNDMRKNIKMSFAEVFVVYIYLWNICIWQNNDRCITTLLDLTMFSRTAESWATIERLELDFTASILTYQL